MSVSQSVKTIPALNRGNCSQYKKASVVHDPRTAITLKQTQVLQLIAKGFSYAETAHELGITVKTVEAHRSKLNQIFGVSGSVLLVRAGILHGILEPWIPLKDFSSRPGENESAR